MQDTKGRHPLARALKEPGRNQVWLAGQLDVDQSSISRWCTGNGRPDATKRAALAGLLGIPEALWLTGDERAAVRKARKSGQAVHG